MNVSLYERLGGTDGITHIVNDIVDNHYNNPIIATRFFEANMTISTLKNGAATFFILYSMRSDIVLV
jgi:hemoglobin